MLQVLWRIRRGISRRSSTGDAHGHHSQVRAQQDRQQIRDGQVDCRKRCGVAHCDASIGNDRPRTGPNQGRIEPGGEPDSWQSPPAQGKRKGRIGQCRAAEGQLCENGIGQGRTGNDGSEKDGSEKDDAGEGGGGEAGCIQGGIVEDGRDQDVIGKQASNLRKDHIVEGGVQAGIWHDGTGRQVGRQWRRRASDQRAEGLEEHPRVARGQTGS